LVVLLLVLACPWVMVLRERLEHLAVFRCPGQRLCLLAMPTFRSGQTMI
jgi:hypothetical protein